MILNCSHQPRIFLWSSSGLLVISLLVICKMKSDSLKGTLQRKGSLTQLSFHDACDHILVASFHYSGDHSIQCSFLNILERVNSSFFRKVPTCKVEQNLMVPRDTRKMIFFLYYLATRLYKNDKKIRKKEK